MFKQEIFILVIIIVLIIVRFVKIGECFESMYNNNFPCETNPTNSNCTCPSDSPKKIVLGQFPMNYGEQSPYKYTCVPENAMEPNPNAWGSLKPEGHIPPNGNFISLK